MPSRILFVPFGSEGDVNPLIWMAEGLARRGHETTFLLTPHYSRLVENKGLPWIPIGTEEDFLKFARDPRLWDGQKGPRTVLKGMANTLHAYADAFDRTEGPYDLVVTSTMALAAAALAEVRGIPRLTVHMQPICLRSVYECPLFLERMEWLCRSPRWVKALFFKLTDLFVWSIARRPLNDFRRELGLAPIRDFYGQALHGGQGVAAFFPAWFAAPQPDWPENVRQYGFPIPGGGGLLPTEVRKFLEAGPPPVVWTHGSANFDIRHFQDCAIRVSKELGIRSLLVSLQPPETVQSDLILHMSHLCFEDLFPHCRAVVHHGGIGTTAKTVAAGIPHLIIPRSHDQPDNAYRIEKLGLGRRLHYADLDTPKLGDTLAELLASEMMAKQCKRFQQIMTDDRPEEILDWTEQIIRTNANNAAFATTAIKR